MSSKWALKGSQHVKNSSNESGLSNQANFGTSCTTIFLPPLMKPRETFLTNPLK